MKLICVCIVAFFANYRAQAYPSSFRVQPHLESEFRFKSVTNISIVILHFTQHYDYKILLRAGPADNQLTIQLKILQIDDILENPTKKDLDALQFPFIIEINGDGDYSSLITTTEETKFSLVQKENVATLLAYNQTEISQGFKSTINTNASVWNKKDTPFGYCNNEFYTAEYAKSYVLTMATNRRECTGKVQGGLLDNFGWNISDDSKLKYTFEMQKITSQFEKVGVSIVMDVNSIPPAHVTVEQHLEFIGYMREMQELDLSKLENRIFKNKEEASIQANKI